MSRAEKQDASRQGLVCNMGNTHPALPNDLLAPILELHARTPRLSRHFNTIRPRRPSSVITIRSLDISSNTSNTMDTEDSPWGGESADFFYLILDRSIIDPRDRCTF